MMRWRLLLEEYNPTVVHVRGIDNNTADALSRIDLTHNANYLREWGVKNNGLDTLVHLAHYECPCPNLILKMME